jgi:hypothetical protein
MESSEDKQKTLSDVGEQILTALGEVARSAEDALVRGPSGVSPSSPRQRIEPDGRRREASRPGTLRSARYSASLWTSRLRAEPHTFNDHYLEVDYDLSGVMFITTANTLNIPPPLMDRMEIIRIAGYTEGEKVEIARKHLIPNLTTKHGLDVKEWAIDDEALLTIILRYTREAGVRATSSVSSQP